MPLSRESGYVFIKLNKNVTSYSLVTWIIISWYSTNITFFLAIVIKHAEVSLSGLSGSTIYASELLNLMCKIKDVYKFSPLPLKQPEEWSPWPGNDSGITLGVIQCQWPYPRLRKLAAYASFSWNPCSVSFELPIRCQTVIETTMLERPAEGAPSLLATLTTVPDEQFTPVNQPTFQFNITSVFSECHEGQQNQFRLA